MAGEDREKMDDSYDDHGSVSDAEGEDNSAAATSISIKAPISTWRDSNSKQKVIDHARKYNLHPPEEMPQEGFKPYTKEERGLLEFYDAVKKFEREELRMKEKKARDHIYSAAASAAKEETESKDDNKSGGGQNAMDINATAPSSTSTKKRKMKEKEKIGPDSVKWDDDHNIVPSSEDDENDDNEYFDDEEKLQQKRDEQDAEERMREELLGNLAHDDDDVNQRRVVKKAKLSEGGEDGGGSSLLSKMIANKTPPHEFSEKLGFKSYKGTVLFPDAAALEQQELDNEIPQWTPRLNRRPKNPNDGAFLVALEGFDITKAVNGEGPNTVAIKFHATLASKRFSFNIGGPNDPPNFESILFHFNPRPREKGGIIVVNDKQNGLWGRAVQLPLSEAPLFFGQESSTIIVQINGDGFDVFVEDKHVARLEHRVELPSRPCSLYLQFPTCDDSRRSENWTVYKTWWGNKEFMAKDDLSNVAGVNEYDSVHPKKLFLNGLKKIYNDDQVELRAAEMQRLFGKYGGPRGVQTVVPKRARYAFVEFEKEEQCDHALRMLESDPHRDYTINRARRTKHEALEMERQAKESGANNDSGDW